MLRPRSAAFRCRGIAFWFFLIFATALVLRLFYLLQARAHDPVFYSPIMDGLYHHQWALSIAAGRAFIEDAFFRAPLYPYFLGLLYRVLGPDLFLVRVVQAVIGSLSCGLVYILGRRLFATASDRAEVVSRTAGFVMAAYPMAIYFDGELLIANLLVFLLLLGFVLLYRARDTDRRWWLPGLVFGLAVIARPNALFFLAVLPCWFLYEFRRRAWKRLAVFLGAVLLVILPVTVRNFLVSRQFVPVAWQAGTNFYIGNNPESDGVTAIVPGTRPDWWGGYNDVRLIAERAVGRTLSGAEIDRYWFGQGLRFWTGQPRRAFRLLVRKAYLWFAGFEISNNRDIYHFKNYTWLGLLIHNRPWFKFPYGLVLPLAFAGVFLLRRSWRSLLGIYLFAGSYSLSFIVFFVTARFRMPIVPVVLLLAVHAAFELIRRKGRSAALLVLVPALLLFNGPISGIADPAHNLFVAAVGYRDRGQADKALEMLDLALGYDSAVNILETRTMLLLNKGRNEEALTCARAAVRSAPDNSSAYRALGSVYAANRQRDSAEASFRRAVELDPYSAQDWSRLGNTALSRGDTTTARRHYKHALGIQPGDFLALYHLGLMDYYAGHREQARRRWQTVLKLYPGNEQAQRALDELR